MEILDIILLVIGVLALLKGMKDGLIRQLGGIAGLFLGIFLASRFSTLMAGWLHQWIDASENVVKAVSFALIIILVCLGMHILGHLFEKIVRLITLEWLNRLLGAALSILTAALLCGIIFSLIEYVNATWFIILPEKTLAESKGAEIVTSVTDALLPYLKTFFKI